MFDRFGRHRDGTCYVQHKLYSSDPQWMPLPVSEDDIFDVTVIDHSFVGGKEKFYEHLGISRTAQLKDMTEEQLEVDRNLRDLEEDFDKLQMDIIRSHPEGVNYEEPRKKSSVEVSRGYMRFLKKAPKGLIAIPIPLKTKGAEDIAKTASQLLQQIASGLYNVSRMSKFRHQNFSDFTLTSGEFDWLRDRSTAEKVLAIHAEILAGIGVWTPLIVGQPLDQDALDSKIRQIDEECLKTEAICEKLLVPARERGLLIGDEVVNYENHSKALPGNLNVFSFINQV